MDDAKFFIHEYASIDGLDLLVFLGTFTSDEWGKTPDEINKFKAERFNRAANMLNSCVMNVLSNQARLFYFTDIGNVVEWYVIENGFLKYMTVDEDIDGGINLLS